jgi:hypothetical protein
VKAVPADTAEEDEEEERITGASVRAQILMPALTGAEFLLVERYLSLPVNATL